MEWTAQKASCCIITTTWFAEALEQKVSFSSRVTGLKASTFQRQNRWTRQMRKFCCIFSSLGHSTPPEAFYFIFSFTETEAFTINVLETDRRTNHPTRCNLHPSLLGTVVGEWLMILTRRHSFLWNYLLLIERENFCHDQAVQGPYN